MSNESEHLDTNWRVDAECRIYDPDIFFPEWLNTIERDKKIERAKRICAVCVVRDICLVDAIESGEKFGIWGGKDERERRYIARYYRRAQNPNIDESIEAKTKIIARIAPIDLPYSVEELSVSAD